MIGTQIHTFTPSWMEDWQGLSNQEYEHKKETAAANKAAGSNAAKGPKLSYKEVRELQSMEQVIGEKENRLGQLQQEVSLPEVVSNYSKLTELTNEISKLETDIKKLYDRWQELEGRPQ